MERSAFLFPGQGAQYVGMCGDLLEHSPAVRQLFGRASDILKYDLAKLCLEGPQESLNRTDICQPALLVAGLAALEFYKSKVDVATLSCSASAGLSLGEYTALVYGGALSFEDALLLVRNRGKYMQEACDAVQSGMASVLGLEKSLVEQACNEASAAGIAVVANLNSPGQIVIAGEKIALEKAGERCMFLGAKRVIPLKVAGAYHSPLMKSAQEKLQKDLATTSIKKPSIPVAANVSATLISDPEEIRKALAVQVVSPVRWEDCMRTMIASGVGTFYEFGPGKVLTGLARKIDGSVKLVAIEKVGDLEQKP